MARTLQRSLATRAAPGQRPVGNATYRGKMPGKQRQLATMHANGGGKPVVHPTSTSNTKPKRKTKRKGQTGAYAMALAAWRRVSDNKNLDKNIGLGSCKIHFQKAPVRRFCVARIRALDHAMRLTRYFENIVIQLIFSILSARIPASLPITAIAGRITTRTIDFVTVDMVQKVGNQEKVDDMLGPYEKARENDTFVKYRMTYI